CQLWPRFRKTLEDGQRLRVSSALHQNLNAALSQTILTVGGIGQTKRVEERRQHPLRQHRIVAGLEVAVQFVQPNLGACRDLDNEPGRQLLPRLRDELNY